MEKRLITQKELAEGLWHIKKDDKNNIEYQVLQLGGGLAESPDLPLRKAIRGYLVQLFDESVPDRRFRKDIGTMAACFSDGWNWAMKLGER